MKHVFHYLILFISLASFTTVSGQNLRQETIKVWGNCGMCKKTIEASAQKGGAATATWDKDTKMLAFSFDETASSSLKVQQAIAASGYDTQDLTADNAAYDKLPGCCHYERKAADAQKPMAKHQSCGKKDCKDCNHEGDMASCCESGKCKKGKKGCKDSCKDKSHCAEKGCGKS